MNYLSAEEYEQFELEATTPAAWVQAASALIDAHCRRPSLGVQQYSERVHLLQGRPVVRLSYLPLATTTLISVRGRYGVPRRGESDANAEFAVGIARAYSLPGTWTALDVGSIDVCCESGELTLPANALGLGFNEVEVTYTAGLTEIPSAVKAACAQIVRNALATPALNVRAGQLDRMHVQYFADTLLSADVCALLAPWVAQKVG
jgi:hypothetical protein